jgi:hypothetical protein
MREEYDIISRNGDGGSASIGRDYGYIDGWPGW